MFAKNDNTMTPPIFRLRKIVTDRLIHGCFILPCFSVKTACESQEYDLQGLLSLADSAANCVERLVLDGGKIPEVSPLSSAVLVTA